MPRVFSDPQFLPGMAHSVYDLSVPSRKGGTVPSPVEAERFSYPEESGDGPSGTVTPKTSLPPSPAKAMDDSDTDSTGTNATIDLDQSQSQESSARSERIRSLRKQHRGASGGSGDGAPLEKRATIKQESSHVERSSPTGISEEVLRNHRFNTYDKDKASVHRVRVQILGLGGKAKPTQEDIDSSPIFDLRRAADDSSTPAVIGQHWIPHLEQEGYLASCSPKELPAKAGWLPLYTRAGVLKHVSDLGHVLNKVESSILIAVVPPKVAFDSDSEFPLPQLHQAECLNRVSITVDGHPRKQIAFCPYCGIMNENTITSRSHARKHLVLAYLCGGCYGKIYKRPCTCTDNPANQWSSTGRSKALSEEICS